MESAKTMKACLLLHLVKRPVLDDARGEGVIKKAKSHGLSNADGRAYSTVLHAIGCSEGGVEVSEHARLPCSRLWNVGELLESKLLLRPAPFRCCYSSWLVVCQLHVAGLAHPGPAEHEMDWSTLIRPLSTSRSRSTLRC